MNCVTITTHAQLMFATPREEDVHTLQWFVTTTTHAQKILALVDNANIPSLAKLQTDAQ